MNETIQHIINRHSTRAYTSDPVPAEALEAILAAGNAAAHGLGFKIRRFTAITCPDALAIVNAGIRDAFRTTPINDHMPAVVKGLIEKANADDNADFIYGAPAFIIISVNADSASGAIDTALSIANMSIAAQSLGFGSCWMNQVGQLIQAPPVRAALSQLGIPEDETVFGTLALGTPDPNGRYAPRAEGVYNFIS
jgi:nitroreductase